MEAISPKDQPQNHQDRQPNRGKRTSHFHPDLRPTTATNDVASVLNLASISVNYYPQLSATKLPETLTHGLEVRASGSRM